MNYRQELHKLEASGNELFDLSDPETAALYAEVRKTQKGEVERRDRMSWHEITNSLESARRAHKGDGLVLLNGAYAHMIGALVDYAAKRFVNLNYIPIKGLTLSCRTLCGPPSLSSGEFVSKDRLRIQMGRAIGVAKSLGFSDMEEMRGFLRGLPLDPTKPTLSCVVLNETGHHNLYARGKLKAAKGEACQCLIESVRQSKQKPCFVLYSGENVNVPHFRRAVFSEQKDLEDVEEISAMAALRREGLSVEICAFGHAERALYPEETWTERFAPVQISEPWPKSNISFEPCNVLSMQNVFCKSAYAPPAWLKALIENPVRPVQSLSPSEARPAAAGVTG